MPQTSKILLRRWPGLSLGATCEENFRKIASQVSGSKDRRYCLGVVADIVGELRPGEGAAQIPPLVTWGMFGRVGLSYHGGYRCADFPVADLTMINLAQGIVGIGKRAALLQNTVLVPQQGNAFLHHSFVIPFAQRFFASGEVDNKRKRDRAFPVSMMGSDSVFRLVLGAASTVPANWSAVPDSFEVRVWAFYQEAQDPIPPVFQRMGRYATEEDPAEIPSGFSKLDTLAVIRHDYGDLSIAQLPLSATTRPKVSVDDKSIYDDISIYEQQMSEGWIRGDSSTWGPYAIPAALLTQFKMLVLVDPQDMDRLSDRPAGNKLEVANLADAEGAKLAYLYDRIDVMPAGEFAVWAERENVSVNPADKSAMSVNGDGMDKLDMTRGQLLGVPITIRPGR